MCARAFVVVRVAKHGETCRQRERSADARDDSGDNQPLDARSDRAPGAAGAKYNDSSDEHPRAAEPVADCPRQHDEAGIRDRVSVDDPLQLAYRAAERDFEWAHGEVDDGRVERNDEDRDAGGDEDSHTASVSRQSFGGGRTNDVPPIVVPKGVRFGQILCYPEWRVALSTAPDFGLRWGGLRPRPHARSTSRIDDA